MEEEETKISHSVSGASIGQYVTSSESGNVSLRLTAQNLRNLPVIKQGIIEFEKRQERPFLTNQPAYASPPREAHFGVNVPRIDPEMDFNFLEKVL